MGLKYAYKAELRKANSGKVKVTERQAKEIGLPSD